MNGKGDSPRNCFSQRFRDNYDLINWTMPTQPPSPCRHPGCPSLVWDHSGYCALHQSDKRISARAYDAGTRRNDPALALAARIRNSVQWQKVRALHKAQCPLCCDPFKVHVLLPRPNQQSHHIMSLIERPDLAYDMTNLAPLCTACHGRVEGMERKGEETRHLFK